MLKTKHGLTRNRHGAPSLIGVLTRRALAGFEPTFPIITACLASALKRLLCCTRQCSVLHSLVQGIKGAGTNTLACAVAIVTLVILHDQGRALPRRERSKAVPLVALHQGPPCRAVRLDAGHSAYCWSAHGVCRVVYGKFARLLPLTHIQGIKKEPPVRVDSVFGYRNTRTCDYSITLKRLQVYSCCRVMWTARTSFAE